ncbi:sensor domain-containing diguanylate cyclase [Wenzhouxiangella sp. AB-CW3]|uniref:sensor domain-containing diguanylate cyclase n=1 Tax=Wenzhouxiangella sp. AB-CW3 TaxID=2771012 RepID=UPI00168BBCB9|nr:sensor domain-containing diguanylate cyclase [Wenzhouxiangella sp. AB-CW3]QOC21273.1 sensor domain-containing diguanylate cyclase [Wenzhouxiangella sp. AB-CW3]
MNLETGWIVWSGAFLLGGLAGYLLADRLVRPGSRRVSTNAGNGRREVILHGLAFSARTLLNARDKSEVMEAALASLGRAVGVDRVYVFENHTDSQDGRLLASQRYEWCGPGVASELDNPDMQDMAYEEILPNWYPALAAGQPIHGLVREMPQPERGLLEPQGIRAIIVVPITINQRFWGQIGFDDCSQEREWSQAEIDALGIAAGVIGGAIVNIGQEREWRRLVSTDSLTGVASRRAFLREARKLCERQGPEVESLALLLMDIDRFKTINDTHGHLVGDEALRSFARICSAQLREGDLIGRTGGEEFAILLRGVDEDTALRLAERLRKAVANERIAVDDELLDMTVSLGVACPDDGRDQRFEDLLEAADSALYAAKRAGRNRVIASGGAGDPAKQRSG